MFLAVVKSVDGSGSKIETSEDHNTGIAPEAKVQIAFTLIICILGLLGNLVVLFVIIILKEYKKSVTHWYVLQLAIADLLFLLVLPFDVSQTLQNAWIYSEGMCKAKESIRFINYYASILFLMIMSIDRYIAVCHTFFRPLQKLRKQKSAFVITFAAFTLSLMMSMPMMLYSKTYVAKNLPTSPCKCGVVFPGENRLGVPSSDYEQYLVSLNNTLGYECGTGERNIVTQNSRKENARSFSKDVDGSLYNVSKRSDDTNLIAEEFEYYGSGSGNYYSGDESGYGGSGNGSRSSDDEYKRCGMSGRSQGWIAYLSFNFAVMFILPLVVMIVCYGLILNRLRHRPVRKPSVQTMQSSENGDSNHKRRSRKKSSSQSTRDRRRVTMMCATLVGCFVICWLPYHAINLAMIATIPGDEDYCQSLAVFGSILAYLNSALNPFLYSFLGGSFLNRTRATAKTIRRSTIRGNASGAVQSFRLKSRRKSSSTSHTAVTSAKILKNSNVKDLSLYAAQKSVIERKNDHNNGDCDTLSPAAQQSVLKGKNDLEKYSDTLASAVQQSALEGKNDYENVLCDTLAPATQQSVLEEKNKFENIPSDQTCVDQQSSLEGKNDYENVHCDTPAPATQQSVLEGKNKFENIPSDPTCIDQQSALEGKNDYENVHCDTLVLTANLS